MIARPSSWALAPVFVLVAMDNIMSVLSTWVVDRSRHLQERTGDHLPSTT